MTIRGWTVLICVVALFGLIFWDIYALVEGGPSATISHVVLDVSWKHPVIPVASGGLLAHLFWPGPTYGPEKVRLAIAGGILVLLGAAGFVWSFNLLPLYPMIAGVGLGRLLVPIEE